MIHKYCRKFVYWYLKKYMDIDSWKLERIANLTDLQAREMLRQMALEEHKRDLIDALEAQISLGIIDITYGDGTKIKVIPS